ncbi:PEGA domain-containing protein [Sandaracinus amylolyticus]|uniref:PEGA domain-containing protein n=1 Tax=Sandaracinus amylolyticus TaxID=927083 RepID=UPI00069DCF89|nr:PEGA domain-containing protein [Sandaracinus amylolyticus]
MPQLQPSRRALTSALLCVLVSISARTAHAQDTWGVIVATTRPTEMQRAIETADHSAAALSATVGGVIPNERAVARVESALSEPFRAAPPEIARRLGQAAEAVLEDVAFGRNQQGLDVGQPLLAELDPHLAGLGRDEQSASDVANLCLYLVRAHVQKRDLGAARQQVQVCLRLVPDLRADERLHPPSVRDLLSETRASLERGEGGILAVHAAPTDPEGCAIRVNGRRMGQTPWARLPLPPGPYVVQIECAADRAGRVHPVQVAGDSPTRVMIHAELAQRLTTRPALALVYTSREQLANHLPEDVALIAHALGATRMLAAVDDGRNLAVRAFAVSDEGPLLVGSAPVPEPIDMTRSREAVAAVLSGRQLDAPVDAAAPTGGVMGEPARMEAGGGGGAPNVASIVLGSILALGGAAGLGVGWYYWTELEAAWATFDEQFDHVEMTVAYAQAQDRIFTTRWIVLGAGAGGGALLTMALPFLLPDEEGVPWWSLIPAAAGAALAGVGIWQLTEEGEAIGPPLTLATEPAWLGAHLIAHAVPLLSVPFIYLVRDATRDRNAGAAVHVDAERAELRVWGSF